MDALSSMLAALPVTGTIFSRAELTAPWGVSTSGAPFAIFHVVARGGGWLRCEDGDPTALATGDLIVLPHGAAHVISDTPDTAPVPLRTLPQEEGGGVRCVRHGGGGAPTSLLCGELHFQPDDPVHALLPSSLHVRGTSGEVAAWLDATLRLISAEVHHTAPGSRAVIDKLAEVLFVQALRVYVAELDQEAQGLLAALGDPQVAPALALIHASPGAWSADELAREVGMSRSAFFAAFTARVGEPPARYLRRFRMAGARRSLRDEDLTLTTLAERFGYSSEAAFSKAFKRETGLSPRAFRKSARA